MDPRRLRKINRQKENSVVKRPLVAPLIVLSCLLMGSATLLAQSGTADPAKSAPPKSVEMLLTDEPVTEDQEPAAEPAQEEADEEVLRTEYLLPAATKAWISIPDADELNQRFNETQFGALSQNESLRPFADHIKEKARNWINEQNVRLNLDIEDLEGVQSGEICFAGVLPEGPDGEALPGQHGVVFLMDVSDTQEEARRLQQKINAELVARGAQQEVFEIQRVQVTRSVIEKPKQFRNKRTNLQAIVNGWMLVSNNEAVFRDVLGRLIDPKSIPMVNTLGTQEAFTTVMQKTDLGDHASQVRWFVSPFGYLQLAQQIKDEEAVSKVARDDWAGKLKNSGFDAFQGVGGNVAIATGEHEVLHRTFVFARRSNELGNKKLFELFDFNVNLGESLDLPDWVPNESSSVVIGNWDTQKALFGFGHFYDGYVESDGAFDRMLNDLKIDPHLQLDVKKLVSLLDNRFVVVSATERPIDVNSERVVGGVRIKGEPEFVFQSIKRANPNAVEISLGGVPVVEIDSTLEEDLGELDDLPEFDDFEDPDVMEEEEEEDRFELFQRRYFVVSGGYLLVSNDKDYLRKVINQTETKLPEAADYRQVQEILDGLTDPSQIRWRHFGRLDLSLETNYEMLRRGEMASSQTVLARVINQVASQQRAEQARLEGKDADPEAVREQELDGSTLPEDFAKSIAPYLGPIGGVMESDSDGWRVTGCILKKKPATAVVHRVEAEDPTPNR